MNRATGTLIFFSVRLPSATPPSFIPIMRYCEVFLRHSISFSGTECFDRLCKLIQVAKRPNTKYFILERRVFRVFDLQLILTATCCFYF